MAVCDICDASVVEIDGYLLTTRQVVGHPAYWQFALAQQWPYVQGCHAETIRGALAARLAEQGTPWLACQRCAAMVGADLEAASRHAQQRWERGEEYVLPGCGPVPLSAVRMQRPPPEVAGSPMPRPAILYVHGKGFFPSDDHVADALQGLVSRHAGLLTTAHFAGVVVQRGEEPEGQQDALFRFLSRLCKQYPAAHLVEVSVPVVLGAVGQELLVLAVWDGAAAASARAQFALRRSQPPPPPADRSGTSPNSGGAGRWARPRLAAAVLAIVLAASGLLLLLPAWAPQTAPPPSPAAHPPALMPTASQPTLVETLPGRYRVRVETVWVQPDGESRRVVAETQTAPVEVTHDNGQWSVRFFGEQWNGNTRQLSEMRVSVPLGVTSLRLPLSDLPPAAERAVWTLSFDGNRLRIDADEVPELPTLRFQLSLSPDADH